MLLLGEYKLDTGNINMGWDESKENCYLMVVDVNSLYGYYMSPCLPMGGFYLYNTPVTDQELRSGCAHQVDRETLQVASRGLVSEGVSISILGSLGDPPPRIFLIIEKQG